MNLGLKFVCFITIFGASDYSFCAMKRVPPIDVTQIGFRNLSPTHELTQSQVTAIAQDSLGFMWFGTPGGLNRFDGYNITKYFVRDGTDSIPHDYVWSLLSDRDGYLWVGTSDGLSVFDPRSQSFEHVMLTNGNEPTVYVLHEAVSGEILAGTSLGLFRVINVEFGSSSASLEFSGEPVRAIEEDPDGRLWIGTERSGLYRQSGNDLLTLEFRSEQADSLSDMYIRELLFDGFGSLWIATYDGGLLFRNSGGKYRNLTNRIKSKRVRALLEDIQGNVWVGSDEGLHRWDRESETFETYFRSSQNENLIGDLVYDLFQDAGGVTWVGTYRGVSYFNNQTTHLGSYSLESLAGDDSISSLAVDSKGIVAIGTHSGIVIWDPVSGTMEDYRTEAEGIVSEHVMSLLYDDYDRLWVGTFDNGVYLFSGSALIAHFVNDPKDSSSISSNAVTDIHQSNSGHIWVSTYGGGVNRYMSIDESFVRYPDITNPSGGFPDMRCYEIGEDNEGKLWIGTASEGVIKLDVITGDTELPVFPKTDWQSNNRSVASILSGGDRMWLGSLEGGLLSVPYESYQDATPHNFDESGGEGVYGLVESGDKSVWISRPGTIIKLAQDESSFLSFDHVHGVQATDLNLNADVLLAPEIVIFGGNDGINVVHTDRVRRNLHVPPIRLTELTLNNKDSHFFGAETLQLEYGINGLSVKVAALDYTYPQNNQYRYKLEGYDEQWINNGTNRNVTYTNLDPGSYVLRVQGSNNEAVWNEQGLSMSIEISPPLWATWWAYCIYVSLALFMFYQMLMVSSRRINREADERFNSRLMRYVESLDDTGEGVLNANSHGSVMFSNNALGTVLGRRPSEVLGYPLFEMLFQHSEQRAEALTQVDSGYSYHNEVPYQMSDGTEKILEVSLSPAMDTVEHDVAYVSIVRDVTKRSEEQSALKSSYDLLVSELGVLQNSLQLSIQENASQRTRNSSSLAEKNLQLRNVHDRVYDNLATLTSLMSIQSGKHSDPAIISILSENQRRIGAVALVHESLYQSGDVGQVSMSEYVDVLLTSLYRSLVPEELDIKLIKELETFELGIAQAVPCGLIINELFSNALIHGFSEQQYGSGEVKVTLSLLANECSIFLSDSGRGLPAEVSLRRDSMGFEIVSILVEQLEGTFRLIGGQGTTFEVRFPVP